MKKNPKTPSSGFNSIVDRKLAGTLIAMTLIGGCGMTGFAAEALGGVESIVPQAVSQKTTVTGEVVDENGDPLVGVTVLVDGTSQGVATDLDGRFTLNVPSNASLTFSYVGYKTVKESVNGRRNLTIKMDPDGNILDDVVVVGYGAVKKRDLTGAVSSVKSDIITLTPASNPMSALQGRVSGLDITQTSGQPGAGLNIQLRGNRSITASGTPLFIIDGMPGDYATINPNDIESIEVLKDASSTAVYGSEGSNGVIIITTKKGQEGKMRVSFDAYLGTNGWSTTPKMNTPEQWIATRKLAREQSGAIVDDSDYDSYLEAIQRGETINWVDEVLKNGLRQNYSLSMSGGTKATQAYFSLNYSDDQGQYKNDDYKVYSSSIRINTQLNNWLSGGVHVQASYTSRFAANSHLADLLRLDPFGTVYNEDGSLNPFPVDGQYNYCNLLLDNDKNVYRNQQSNLRLYVQPYIRITPIKGMTLESRLSGNFNYSNRNSYNGYGSYSYYKAAGQIGLTASRDEMKAYTNASINNSRSWGYTWENILTYNFKLADIHEFTLTGVTSWSSSQSDGSNMSTTEIPSNKMYWTNMGKATDLQPSIGSSYSMHKRMGYVGRINYTLMGRYLFSASVRRDGDSVLASGRHWSTFPAVSAGWRISDESFMDATHSYLNNLKLRVSYGETGAAGLSPYSSYTLLQGGQMALGGVVTSSAFFPQIVSNPSLTWERSKSWNIGLDLGFFNNRIDLAAEYYITNTDDVIWKQALPANNGAFSAQQMFQTNKNIATTRNNGIELTLNTQNIVTKDFTWSSTLTFSRNWEKVKSLGADASEYIEMNPGESKGYTLHVGDPIKSYRSYQFGGIWQKYEEADAAVFNCLPGDMKVIVPNMYKVSDGVWEKRFVNEEGEETVQTYDAENTYSPNQDDRVIIGHNSPDWQLGFQNTFTYKGFDLSIYMFWRYGQKFWYDPIGWYTGGGGMFPSDFNYWTEDNPSNDFPALNTSRNWQKAPGADAIYWVDGSFFKIKNITLGYTVPASLSKKAGISNARVYGTITNPLIYAKSDKLKGYDPEMNGSFNFPLTRQLVFGLNVTF